MASMTFKQIIDKIIYLYIYPIGRYKILNIARYQRNQN